MAGVFPELLQALRPWGQAVLDLVFPPRCQVCGAADAFPLCGECWARFPRISWPVCDVCGRPLRGPPDLVFTCVPCRRRREPLRVRAFGRYDGPLREAVHALKYRGKLGLVEPLGRGLAEVAAQDPRLSGVDAIVPVPLHPRREGQRGFNQAEELARVVSVQLGRPVRKALVRVRDTPSQTELDEDQRRRNVREAFAVRGRVDGLRLLLVDDVVTTGSTLGECAAILRRAGAEDVYAVAVAMVVPDA